MIVLTASPRVWWGRQRDTCWCVSHTSISGRFIRGSQQIAIDTLDVQGAQALHSVGVAAWLQFKNMEADKPSATGGGATGAPQPSLEISAYSAPTACFPGLHLDLLQTIAGRSLQLRLCQYLPHNHDVANSVSTQS